MKICRTELVADERERHWLPVTALLIAFASLAPRPAVADSEEEALVAADPVPPEPPAEAKDEALEAMEQRLSSAEAENRVRAEVAASQEERIARLESRVEEMEQEAEEALLEGVEEFTPSVSIYGFFDVSLYRWWLDEDDAARLTIPEDLSFAATGFNLYLLSQMTPSVSVLAEVYFTYMPHGSINLETFDVVETTARHPYSAKDYRLGSTYIERLQVTWQPRDWFGVTAGRFITPYGIWNIDHGSPVLIPIFAPYILSTELVLPRQTGLMVHGRFIPTEQWMLDYAVTLSNGRGQYDQVFDLDDNKGLGLRLRSVLTLGKVNFALGGYGYVGKSTDKVTVVAQLDPFRIADRELSSFWEWTLAVDFQLQLFGVTLQGEWAGTRIRYDTRPTRTMPMVGVAIEGELAPDYIAHVAYVLLAWELPLDDLLGDVKVSPYVMLEWSDPRDLDDYFDLWLVRFGLNVKPISAIALKLEGGYLEMEKSTFVTEPSWQIGSQIAVAF